MFPSVRWSHTEWLLVSVSHETLKLFPLGQWVRGLPCDPVRGGGGEGVIGEGRMRGTLNLQTYRRLTHPVSFPDCQNGNETSIPQ